MGEDSTGTTESRRPIYVVVCSFNRGRFLEHCVQSIERHAPQAHLWVVDDRSDDGDTVRALERIGDRHRVMRPATASTDNPKVGGLYNNMQLVLEALPSGALVMFLQDDMQFVRDLEALDWAVICAHFEASPRAAFLWCNFLKGYRRDSLRMRFDASRGVYFRELQPGQWGAHYAAAVTGDVDRLRAVDWRFARREKLNDAQAVRLFEPMGYLRDPLTMFLPSVPVYRFRRKSLALRLAERRIGAGFHPYRPMEGDVLRRLRERDPAELAFAEDWLSLAQADLPRPWQWGPFQNSRWLRKLDKLERLRWQLTSRKP